MIKEIKMPAGGQTTDVSVVGNWLVKIGDKVGRGDALLEIETDKATLTVESYTKGTVLALLVEEGDEASAGDVIALIGDESDKEEAAARISGGSSSAAAEAKEESPAKEAQPEENEPVNSQEEEEYQPIDKKAPRRTKDTVSEAGSKAGTQNSEARNLAEIKAMPNAKLMAKENNVSLADVAEATGKDILKRQDVKAFLEMRRSGTLPEKGAQEKNAAQNSAVVGSEDTLVPFTTMRKVIARRMTESAQNIPVFAATVEIDMTQCIAFRKMINSVGGKKVSYNDILFKCMDTVLRYYPYVNASYTDEGIVLHKDVNIGLAVSIEGGLVVPVVRKVQEKSISEISACNRGNIEKAREKKLAPEEMTGGTITLSNLGMYPVTQFTAIINSPEACILAVGAIEEKPVLSDGEWKAVPVMKLTGSFDHRIIDGAYAAEFLSELKEVIENPALALV